MSLEWNHNIIPNAVHQITVPTQAQRGGDFSNTVDAAGVKQIIYDPLTRSATLPQGSPFPNGIIPTNRFSPFGPATLNFLPQPNTVGQLAYNYQSQVPSSQPSYDQIYRVDYNMSDKWHFFVRGLDNEQTQNVPYVPC